MYLLLKPLTYIHLVYRCRKQIVSFVVSALGDVDVFGENSHNSSMNLLLVLSAVGDGSGNEFMLKTSFVQDVTEELHSQSGFEAVALSLLGMCYEGLNTTAVPMNIMSPPLSILDSLHQPALSVLLLLFQADKRYLKFALSGALPNFRLSSEVVETYRKAMAAATVQSLLPPNHEQLGNSYYMQSMRGVCGCAVEHQTLLGRMLRVAPDVSLRVRVSEY